MSNLACGFAAGLVDFVALDPRFAALDISGPPVLNLKLGSPAIDFGDPTGCSDEEGQLLTTDQLGTQRPQGMRCDVGAIEAPTRR